MVCLCDIKWCLNLWTGWFKNNKNETKCLWTFKYFKQVSVRAKTSAIGNSFSVLCFFIHPAARCEYDFFQNIVTFFLKTILDVMPLKMWMFECQSAFILSEFCLEWKKASTRIKWMVIFFLLDLVRLVKLLKIELTDSIYCFSTCEKNL